MCRKINFTNLGDIPSLPVALDLMLIIALIASQKKKKIQNVNKMHAFCLNLYYFFTFALIKDPNESFVPNIVVINSR